MIIYNFRMVNQLHHEWLSNDSGCKILEEFELIRLIHIHNRREDIGLWNILQGPSSYCLALLRRHKLSNHQLFQIDAV
jgi:hypothetical protein